MKKGFTQRKTQNSNLKAVFTGFQRKIERNTISFTTLFRFKLPAYFCLVFLLSAFKISAQISINNINYNTLNAAFSAINSGVHNGYIIIEISGSTIETQTAILEESGVGMANYDSISFFVADSNLVILGNILGPLVQLNGAERVDLNGFYKADSKQIALTLMNEYNQPDPNVSVVEFAEGASNNKLRGVAIAGSSLSENRGLVSLLASNKKGAVNNVITECLFTSANSNSAILNRPRYAFYSSGTSNLNAENNFVIKNHFKNIVLASNARSAKSAAIFLDDFCTNWTITENHFYEEIDLINDFYRFNHFSILISPTNSGTKGNNFIITQNYIGGSKPNSLGTPWFFHGEIDNKYVAIQITTKESGENIISNNQITNFSISSSGTEPFTAIALTEAHAIINENQIGTNGTKSSILVYREGVANIESNFAGILIKSSNNNCYITNNFIGSITTVPKSISQIGIMGIYLQSALDTSYSILIKDNRIGDSTINNSIIAEYDQLNEQHVYGILASATCYVSIINNKIANITNSSNGPFAKIAGIEKFTPNGSNTYLIQENKIGQLFGFQANLNPAFTSPVGIYANGDNFGGQETIIRNNFIEELVNNSDGIGSFYVYGIVAKNGTQRFSKTSITQNFINNLRFFNNTNDTGKVAGISILSNFTTQSVVTEVSNNIITLNANPISNYGFYGILDWGSVRSGTSNVETKILFNTIYISGTSSDTSQETACIRVVEDGTMHKKTIRNNVFVNERQGQTFSSSDNHFCVMLPTISGTIDINNNNYYNGPGNGGALGKYGSTIHYVLSTWQSGPNSPSQDLGSVSVDPNFAGSGGGLPGDYYPQTSSIGEQIIGLSIDFFQYPRASNPRIGAIETAYKIWNGRISVNWGNPNNWTPTGVPATNEDIVVPENVQHYPHLDISRIIGKLFTESRAIVGLNANALTINNTINLGAESKFKGNNNGRLQVLGIGDVNKIELVQDNSGGNTLKAFLYNRTGTCLLENTLLIDSFIVQNGVVSIGDNAKLNLQNFYNIGTGKLDASNPKSTLILYGANTVVFNNNGIEPLIANLQITQLANWQLQTNNQILGTLTMNGGNILTGNDTLLIGNNLANNGSIDYKSGQVQGTLKRWYGLQSYQVDSGLFFPIGTVNGKKFVKINYITLPSTFGSLVVSFKESFMGMNGLPIKIQSSGACDSFVADSVAFGYWEIEPQNGLFGGNYDINLNHEGFFGNILNTCEMTSLKRIGNNMWLESGTHQFADGTVNSPIVKRLNATGWSNWGIAYQKLPFPLPVELISFTAKKLAKSAFLSWVTTNEQNNSHFEIERSFDGDKWFFLDKVNATTVPMPRNEYNFEDKTPISGWNYYRLKQVDFNGEHSYSPIKAVKFGSKSNIVVAPNPTKGISTLKSETPIENVIIFDQFGRIIKTSNQINTNHLEIDFNGLAKGIYWIHIKTKESVIIEKIISI